MCDRDTVPSLAAFLVGYRREFLTASIGVCIYPSKSPVLNPSESSGVRKLIASAYRPPLNGAHQVPPRFFDRQQELVVKGGNSSVISAMSGIDRVARETP